MLFSAPLLTVRPASPHGFRDLNALGPEGRAGPVADAVGGRSLGLHPGQIAQRPRAGHLVVVENLEIPRNVNSLV